MSNKLNSKPPRVLAVIVNWNKRDYLRNLLLGLRELGGSPFEILVVDNASTDGSVEMVREEFPECHLHETGANLGGTGGFNAGMVWGLTQKDREYDFFWLMDNDIRVHPGALDELLRVMRAKPKAGVVGSAILSMEEPDQVQEIGARIDWKTLAPVKNAHGSLKRITEPRIYRADYAAACSLLARVEAVKDTGIWDPSYFVQWDDIDWGLRMQESGWEIYGCSSSRVEHENFDNRRHGQSPVLIYLITRNTLYTASKRSGRPGVHGLYTFIRCALSAAENARVTGRENDRRAILKAIEDFRSGRMGTPPFEAFKADQPFRPETAEAPPAEKLRRIGIITFSASEDILQFHRRIRDEHPEARIDTVMIDAKRVLAENPAFENVRNFNARSFANRVRIALALMRDYDAIAVPAFVSTFFYFELVPWRIRIDPEEGVLLYEPRNLRRILYYLTSKPKVALQAWRLARETARMEPATVDYHPYRNAPAS